MSWKTENPPKDGTPIIAIGRVIWEDEFSTSIDPFMDRIFWQTSPSGLTGWFYWRDKLSVASALGRQEVAIDYWTHCPETPVAARPVPSTMHRPSSTIPSP
jgi:hypothetical protein